MGTGDHSWYGGRGVSGLVGGLDGVDPSAHTRMLVCPPAPQGHTLGRTIGSIGRCTTAQVLEFIGALVALGTRWVHPSAGVPGPGPDPRVPRGAPGGGGTPAPARARTPHRVHPSPVVLVPGMTPYDAPVSTSDDRHPASDRPRLPLVIPSSQVRDRPRLTVIRGGRQG